MGRPTRQIARDLLGDDPLLSTGDVAEIFAVDARTVARWVRAGLIPNRPDGSPGTLRLGDGNHRIRESVVRGLLNGTLKFDDSTELPREEGDDGDQGEDRAD